MCLNDEEHAAIRRVHSRDGSDLDSWMNTISDHYHHHEQEHPNKRRKTNKFGSNPLSNQPVVRKLPPLLSEKGEPVFKFLMGPDSASFLLAPWHNEPVPWSQSSADVAVARVSSSTFSSRKKMFFSKSGVSIHEVLFFKGRISLSMSGKNKKRDAH